MEGTETVSVFASSISYQMNQRIYPTPFRNTDDHTEQEAEWRQRKKFNGGIKQPQSASPHTKPPANALAVIQMFDVDIRQPYRGECRRASGLDVNRHPELGPFRH
jgi:hypothetical protein